MKKFTTSSSIIYYSILIFLFLLSSGTSLWLLQSQKYDSFRINMAGRQRMLTQKLSKEIILYSHNITRIEEIEQTMQVFEITLLGITRGGDVPIDIEMKKFKNIPGMDDTEARSKLEKIILHWKNFKEHAFNYIRTADANSFSVIIKDNVNILSEINEAVSLIEIAAEKRYRYLQFSVLSAIAVIFIILGITLSKKIKQVRAVRSEIEKLESILPICSNCKRIRLENADPFEQKSWVSLEEYFKSEKDINFSHSICPQCTEKLYPGMLEKPVKK